MMLQCHSAAQFHDYRLRGGSGGSFSFSATSRNYELSVAQLGVESPDVNAGRLVRKNLYRPEVFGGAQGIAHRGGPLLEDFADAPANGADCDALGLDYDGGALDEMPAYCVIREWHRREREARAPAPFSSIVYVKRTRLPGPNRLQDFDVYTPGAELRRVLVTVDDAGAITLGDDTSLNAGCGFDVAAGHPAPRRVVGRRAHRLRRARVGERAAADLRGQRGRQRCAPHAEINAGPAEGNGILIHNFDPAYSPPDQRRRHPPRFLLHARQPDASAYGLGPAAHAGQPGQAQRQHLRLRSGSADPPAHTT